MCRRMDSELARLASRVQMLLLDVDGVMNDGKFFLVPMAARSVVGTEGVGAFDGAAIGFARRAGIKLGIISGRGSPAVTRRAEELKFDFCYQGLGRRKMEAFNEIVAKVAFSPDAICYMGDDVQDIPILRRVGFPVAVANA